MSQLLRGAILSAAAILAASSAPALAVVYTVTFGGDLSDNYVETIGGARQDFLGGTFSAVFTFDTDLLPVNTPDTGLGETFRYALDGGWFTSNVTITGGAAPAFVGAPTLNSLRGAFGPAGYVDLQDDRELRDDAGGYESASLLIGGFDGLDAVSGIDFPDFLTAQNLTFTLFNSFENRTNGDRTSTYAFGDVDSVTMTTAGVVPEPATWATMALGFGLLGAAARRRRSVARA